MNWPVYNKSLVRRGEILLGFDVIDNWDTELKEMNKDKIGEPFHYPNTFLLLLGYAKAYFFIFLIDRLRELHKAMLNGKYLPFLITLQ
jgi:hypothetical protein